MKIILATRNSDKVREIKELLADIDVDLLTLEDFPQIPEIIEDGSTLRENAYKKAKTVYDETGVLTLADDTGLEIDALNGRPGVFSSRFAGEQATYDDNVNKVLKMMASVPDEKRSARFRCVISIVGHGVEEFAEGMCEGIILRKKRGTGGFGYDPIFYIPAYQQTFSEMPLKLKNEISHRGKALKEAVNILRRLTAKDG